MTSDHLFRANLCANLANLSHLQLPLCKAMSCIPLGWRPVLPERICGEGQGLLGCKISSKRGNKEHGISGIICKKECVGADKSRGREKH